MIKGDERVAYGAVVAVLDALKAAEIEGAGLVIEPRPDGRR